VERPRRLTAALDDIVNLDRLSLLPDTLLRRAHGDAFPPLEASLAHLPIHVAGADGGAAILPRRAR
jgi:hypothetical protein